MKTEQSDTAPGPAPPVGNGQRKLLDGSMQREYLQPVSMTITSHCPGKWAFVDMETGDVWVTDQYQYKPNDQRFGRFYWIGSEGLTTLCVALVTALGKQLRRGKEEHDKQSTRAESPGTGL